MKTVVIGKESEYRKAISSYLAQSDMELWIMANSFEELVVKALKGKDPDLLVVELDEESRPHFFKYSRLFPQAYIIIYTDNCNESCLEELICEGADALILKNEGYEALQIAIDSVKVGEAYMAPRATRMLFDNLQRGAKMRQDNSVSQFRRLQEKHQFKARETQIAEGLISGHTYEDIASQYNININTVRYYVKTLYRKLGIHKRSELMHLVYETAMTS